MSEEKSGLGSSRRPPVTVTLVIGHPRSVDRKQGGGEPQYEPDEDDLDEEEVPGSPEEEDNRRIVIEAAKALRGQSQDPQMALNEFLEVYGKEKLAELKQFVSEEEESPQGYAEGGRLVEGPGRGLDDRIAARAGDQPVLLSDGEFVVPADVVSHLGDGSTKAGVRALEAMMARARHAKTGRKTQAKKIDMKKVLPA